jgi:hypothetical protein
MSSADVIEALRQVNIKLDVILARLGALEGRMLETEEPEPGDVEAYAEAEGELERGELKPFKRC